VARDDAVAAGITVNGLPILEVEEELDRYYRESVIGGPDAFMIAADDFESFGKAILQKLVTEIAFPSKIKHRATGLLCERPPPVE